MALLPSAVYQLVKRGHHVLVESNAGRELVFTMGTTGLRARRLSKAHEEVFSRRR